MLGIARPPHSFLAKSVRRRYEVLHLLYVSRSFFVQFNIEYTHKRHRKRFSEWLYGSFFQLPLGLKALFLYAVVSRHAQT